MRSERTALLRGLCISFRFQVPVLSAFPNFPQTCREDEAACVSQTESTYSGRAATPYSPMPKVTPLQECETESHTPASPCASLVSRGALSHFIEISPRAKFFYILPVSYNRTEPSVSISETCRFHMTPTPRAKIGQELEAQASLSFPGDFMAWGREP